MQFPNLNSEVLDKYMRQIQDDWYLILMSYRRYLCLVAYSGVQHIVCCVVGCIFLGLRLVYGGVQHILCCLFCFVCLRLVSCATSVVNVSGLSILDCPSGFYNIYLPLQFFFKYCIRINHHYTKYLIFKNMY